MGFMAGFGAGFSKSFEAQRDRSHEREQDNFRYRMETLLKKKSTYDEERKAAEANVTLAKEIVSTTGNDPDSVAKAYNMLQGGMGAHDVYAVFAGGKFAKKQQAPAPEDIQTEALVQPEAPQIEATQPTEPAQQDTGGGGLLSQIFPEMGKKMRQNSTSGVDARVQETTGYSADEIAQYDAGYQAPGMQAPEMDYTPNTDPKDLDTGLEAQIAYDQALVDAKQFPDDEGKQAKVKQLKTILDAAKTWEVFENESEGIATGQVVPGQEVPIKIRDKGGIRYSHGVWKDGQYVDAEGKPIAGAIGVSKEEKEDLRNVANKLQEPARKVLDAQVAFNGAARAASVMNEAVEATNGDVLKEWSTSMAQLGSDLTGEAATAVKLLTEAENGTVGDIDRGQLEGAVKTIEDSYNASGAGKLAHAAVLFKAQSILLTYNYAKMLGQDGTKLAEAERQAIQKVATAGNNPDKFRGSLSNILLNQAKQIDDMAAQISNDPEVGAYKALHDNAIPDIFNPQPTLKFAGKDPKVKRLLDVLSTYEGKEFEDAPAEQQKPEDQKKPQEQNVPPAPPGFKYEKLGIVNGVKYHFYRGEDGTLTKIKAQ